MSYHNLYEFDSMAGADEMEDFIDEIEDENYGGCGGDMGVDEYKMLTKVTDTSAAQARKGKDIQGIQWERLNITRERYKLTRLEQYRNYENIPSSGEAVDKECKQMEKGGKFYEFFHNTRLVKPTILHFQCHRQTGNKACGYYVMRHMLNIIFLGSTEFTAEMFNITDAFSEEDIDDVRRRWTTFFLEVTNL